MLHGATQQLRVLSERLLVRLFAQRNFGASRCSVCGMVYSKGHEEDEKLHKAYHQGAVQGFKFQVGGSNWATVAASSGRLCA